jgi:hypothetical protein
MRPWHGLLAALVLVPAVARADGPNDHERAVQLFDEGRKLIEEQHDCDNALPKLESSLRYEQSVGAHLSTADCIESHNPLDAWKHLREAQRLAYLKHDDRTKIAADRATALEARLPVVHVVIPQGVLEEPGLEVRVDGAVVDRFFYESGKLAMTAGPHVVEASTPTRRWQHDVVAQAGATTAVNVQLEPLHTVNTALPTQDTHDRGGTQRGVGLVLMGIGLGGLAAGGILGTAALVKKTDVQNACGGNASACNAPAGSLDSAVADGQTFAHLSTMSFVVGSVALATGFVLFMTAPHGRTIAVTGGVGSLGLVGTF